MTRQFSQGMSKYFPLFSSYLLRSNFLLFTSNFLVNEANFMSYFPLCSYRHIWTDPYPYTHVEDNLISQECPGLDTHPEDKWLIIGVLVVLGLGVVGCGVAVWFFRDRGDDGYETIE
jgi:hypothetical protein